MFRAAMLDQSEVMGNPLGAAPQVRIETPGELLP
jgi:hypothetical protein